MRKIAADASLDQKIAWLVEVHEGLSQYVEYLGPSDTFLGRLAKFTRFRVGTADQIPKKEWQKLMEPIDHCFDFATMTWLYPFRDKWTKLMLRTSKFQDHGVITYQEASLACKERADLVANMVKHLVDKRAGVREVTSTDLSWVVDSGDIIE